MWCETIDEWKHSLCERLWSEKNEVLVLDEAGRHSEIEKRAYEKWKNAGEPSGNALNFWLEAEAEVDEALFD